MIQWTQSAKNLFERYCERTRESLRGSGADADEVIDDLRRHLDEEIQSVKLTIVTEDDMRRILNRIGEPSNLSERLDSKTEPASPSPAHPQAKPKSPSIGLLILGVVSPLVTLFFEWYTGWSATVLFDPIPNWPHMAAIMLVPAVNLWMWIAALNQSTRSAKLMGWLNGIAIGVCLWYGLFYLPFVPFAIFGLIWFGAGLIPLGPYLALIGTIGMRASYSSKISGAKPRGAIAGAVVGLGIMLLMELPAMMTYRGLSQAVSDDPDTRRSGISCLRTFGSEKMVLEACYGLNRNRSELGYEPDFVFALNNNAVTPEEARSIYYRVWGRPFNSVPPPSFRGFSQRWEPTPEMEDLLAPDDGLGGEKVAGQVKGLSLVSSRLDAEAEPAAALAYTEWTMEFRNMSGLSREARAQIALPPGGVVSRLTLWVNGQEREAAFGGRSQVRSAYTDVAIVRRRDPALVTTCGPDRILLQCFPVPASGGTMKIRVGITAPLTSLTANQGAYCWPKLLERNFAIPADFKHALWIEAPTKMIVRNETLKSGSPQKKAFALHGSLKESSLEESEAVLVERPPDATVAWTPALEKNSVIVQKLVPLTNSAPQRVVLVVDGSAGMKEHAAQLSQALEKFSEGVDLKVLVAGDAVMAFNRWDKATPEVRASLERRLNSFSFMGGCDNLEALEQAWDFAAEGGGVVVWIHASQPFLLSSTGGLRQRLERSATSVKVISLQAGFGPDRITEELDGLPDVSVLPTTGGLRNALEQLFLGWSGNAVGFETTRQRLPCRAENTNGIQVSRHIERLWANEEVKRQLAGRHSDSAMLVAAANQVVTAASGAVVLETAQQYAQNNLTPADPATVPTVPMVPEPATWALMLVAGCLLFARRIHRKRCAELKRVCA